MVSLWLCMNDILKSPFTLQCPEHKEIFMMTCSQLKRAIKEVFTKLLWQNNLRIGPPSPEAALPFVPCVKSLSQTFIIVFVLCVSLLSRGRV